MSNLAYEVALEIRQAQTYSLGVKTADAEGIGETFNTRYGVFFDLDNDNETTFLNFADFYPPASLVNPNDEIDIPDGNGFCNSGGSADAICSATSVCGYECLEKVNLVQGITFDKICVSDEGTDPVDLESGDCSSGAEEVDNVHISFARPYTNAYVNVEGEEFGLGYNAGIVLQSTAGSKRAVIIKGTGQISVEKINVDN